MRLANQSNNLLSHFAENQQVGWCAQNLSQSGIDMPKNPESNLNEITFIKSKHYMKN